MYICLVSWYLYHNIDILFIVIVDLSLVHAVSIGIQEQFFASPKKFFLLKPNPLEVLFGHETKGFHQVDYFVA